MKNLPISKIKDTKMVRGRESTILHKLIGPAAEPALHSFCNTMHFQPISCSTVDTIPRSHWMLRCFREHIYHPKRFTTTIDTTSLPPIGLRCFREHIYHPKRFTTIDTTSLPPPLVCGVLGNIFTTQKGLLQ